jgi:Flp pilus assembly protein TadB
MPVAGSLMGTSLTATTLVAVAAGVAVPAGLALILHGLLPQEADRPRRRRRLLGAAGRALRAGTGARGRCRRTVAAASVAVGAGVWLLSGWVVAVVVVPLAALGLPALLRPARTGAAVDRSEALEEWTRRLAGVLDVGVGLEQAITVNLRSTPEAIRPPVQALVARLRARWRTDDALRAFADDLDDATGDLVAAALILGAQRRGTGLTRVLTGLADTVADEVRMRRQVEADRAKPRTTARAVTLITLAVLGLLTLNSAYIAPYGDPLGQMVLALLLGLYAGALAWMTSMGRTRPAPRFLTAPTPRAEPAAAARALDRAVS